MSIGLSSRAADLAARSERAQSLGYDYETRATVQAPKCNVCGCVTKNDVASHDRYGFPAKFVECGNCFLTWITPRMSVADYADFYLHWYRPLLTAWYGRPMSADDIQGDQAAYTSAFVEHMGKHILPYRGKRLLDVGGSTGVTAAAIRDAFDMDATVLDPSDEELSHAEKRGLKTQCSLIEFAPLTERYDVITMLQTIEHLMDPRGVLQKLRGMLNPGGIIIFDFVPHDDQRRNVRPIEAVLKIDHLYYFSKYTMLELIPRSGLRLRGFEMFTGRQLHYVCEAA